MADIEELGGLLVGGADEVHTWGEDALYFLDYAHDESGLGQAQIIPNRPLEPAPKVAKNKRSCCDDDRPHWPASASACQPFITVVKAPESESLLQAPQPLEDDEDDDDQSQAGQEGASGGSSARTVGSRGSRSYASRMERKATREKMRRLELNDKFNELAEVLLDLEPCRHTQGHGQRHSRAPTDKGNFRVELLSRAIKAMKNLSDQTKAERSEVDRLQKQLDALKLVHQPHPAAMTAPVPALAPPTADANGGVNKKPSSAPMWVTVPVWMPQANGVPGGAKAAGMGGASFPMAMPLYMAQQQQQQQQQQAGGLMPMDASPANSASNSSTMMMNSMGGGEDGRAMLKQAMGANYGMPVFPPMSGFMHPGFGPVTMVPPPQVSEQQEAPTHAPCA